MVATTTQSFPRGKKAPPTVAATSVSASSTSQKSAAKKRKLDGAAATAIEVDEDEDTGADALFGKKAAARAAGDNVDKKKSKSAAATKKPKLSKPEDKDSKDKDATATVITFKSLHKGVLLLGCVRQVTDTELLVSLPNKLNGVVPAAECSDEFFTHYAKMAKAANTKKPSGADSDATDDALAPLNELFAVGQFVPCVVVSTSKAAKGKQIVLSLRTSLVHSELVPQSVTKGMALHATVASVEDHGAIVNLGVRGLTAFVPRKELAAAALTPRTGQHMLVSVLSMNAHTSTVTVTPDRATVVKAVTRGDAFTVQQLVPGMLLNVRVDDVLSNGLRVNFLTFFTATVEQNHMSHPCQRGWASAYKKGLKGRARIVSIDAATKQITLSMAPHVVHLALPESRVAVGDIVTTATIERIDEGIGMLLSLQPSSAADATDAMDVDDDAAADKSDKVTWKTFTPAYVHISNASDSRVDKLEKKFDVGATVAARVIGFAPFDALVTVTLKASSLSQKVLRHVDLAAGESVRGKILAIESWGILLELSEGVRGLVSPQHVPPFVALTKPAAGTTTKRRDSSGKFAVGKTVSARVLRVDVDAKKTYLTMKQALLTSELAPLTTYDDATIGRSAHGVITKIADYGVVVSFYNNVYGLVPAALLREAGVTNLEDAYVLGQVVKAVVTRCDVAKQRVMLSFNATATTSATPSASDVSASASALVGQTVSHVKVLDIEATCVRVQTTDGLEGVLPFVQLTDFPRATALVDARVQQFAAGDVLTTPLLVLAQAKDGVLTLSQKPLLLQFANDRAVIPRAFSDVKDNAPLLGYVASVHATKGVFIKFLNNVTALAPKAFLTDAFLSEVHDGLFEVGETVLCHVTKRDAARQQVVVSCRRHAALRARSVKTLPLFVEAYFNEYAAVTKMTGAATPYVVGKTEKAEFLGLRPYGAVFTLEKDDATTTVVVADAASDSWTESDSVKLALVDYDADKRVYFASADKALVASGAKKARKHKQRLAVGATVAAATVVAIGASETYAVVSFADPQSADAVQLGMLQLADFWCPSQSSSSLGLEVGSVVPACRVAVSTLSVAPFTDLPLLVRAQDEPLLSNTKVSSGSSKKSASAKLDGESAAPALPKYRSDDLALGHVLTGRIVVIKEHSMEIKVKTSKRCGKVLATVSIVDVDAADDHPHPFDAFSVNMVVTGRVLAVLQKGANQRKPVSEDNPAQFYALHLSLRAADVASDCDVADLVRADWDDESAGRTLLTVGKQVDGVVVEQSDEGLAVRLSHRVIGFVSAPELSTDLATLQTFRAQFPVGKRLACTIVGVDAAQHHVDLSLTRTSALQSEALVPGTVVRGLITRKVSAVKPPSLMVRLSAHVHGRVCVTELLPRAQWQSAMLALPAFAPGTFVECVVLASSKSGAIDLSLRADALADPTAYVKAAAAAATYKAGDLVTAVVASTTAGGCFVRVDRVTTARVLLRDLSDAFVADPTTTFPSGRLVAGRVTKVDDRGQLELSLKASVVSDDVAAVKFKDLRVGLTVKGTITKVQPYGVFVQIDKSTISGLCHISEVADERVTTALDQVFAPGDYVKAKILKIDGLRVSFGLKPSYFDGDDASSDDDSDSDSDESEGEAEAETMDVDAADDKDDDASSSSDDDDDASSDEEQVKDEEQHKPAKATPAVTSKQMPPVAMDVDDNDSDDAFSSDEAANTRSNAVGFAWDGFANVLESKSNTTTKSKAATKAADASDSETDDDETDNAATTTTTKTTNKKPTKQPSDEWVALREKALARNDAAPQQADDFERLLAVSPQSSYLWIQYMAFHVSLTEVALARDVAARATTAVSFRDATEKLNVWCAWLTLEHDFGDDASFARVFAAAVAVNAPKRVYMHLVDLYARAGEATDAAATLATMQKKFRTSKQTWLRSLVYHIVDQQAFGVAAETLQRALQALAAHKHLTVILKYGQLLFEAGELEKARTIFEGILATYPKRMDLWNVYVDKEIKCGDSLDRVRALLERLVAMDFSAKKMKFLFKKYMAFESEHGDAARVEHVKTLAKTFVAQAAAASGGSSSH